MNPDPKDFARTVLGHLASLKADIYRTNQFLAELVSVQTGRPIDQVREEWEKEAEELEELFYQQALKQAGIEDRPGPDAND